MVELMTIPEAASLLRVSPDLLYAAARDGRLAAHRFGAAVRVSREDLEAFVRRSRVAAMCERAVRLRHIARR